VLGLYDFVYGELCDWYLEFLKGREIDEDLAATISYLLRETLALAHPFIPFVSEELWSHVAGDDAPLLALSPYPGENVALIDTEAESHIAELVAAVTAVRAWRETSDLPAKAVLLAKLPERYAQTAALAARLAKLDLEQATVGEPSATVAVPGGQALIYAGDLVDPAAQAAKLQKRREKLRGEIGRAESKLANEGFVAKAPPQLVAAEREKLEKLRAELTEMG
jgi:valyl-tRNA synthetase